MVCSVTSTGKYLLLKCLTNTGLNVEWYLDTYVEFELSPFHLFVLATFSVTPFHKNGFHCIVE